MEDFFDRPEGRLHYRVDGNDGAPWLMLSNSLGTDYGMWEPQIASWTQYFRVLRYDTRGHGKSALPPGPCTMADLAGDALALLDHLGIARTNFCGLSLGGMTGMQFAMRHPQRLEHLALCNTSPYMGPPSNWDARIAAVKSGGMHAVTDGVIGRWFTPRFREQSPEDVGKVRQMLLETHATGYAACCAAIRDMDQRESIKQIVKPVLVISGSKDPATPPADGKLIAGSIVGAKYVDLDAAHLSNWEQVEAFGVAVKEFMLD
jgi:3-oxoadipate enol-lactonase